MRISSRNLHAERDLRTRWDVLLGIVADFSISVDQTTVYSEQEFCVVELWTHLVRWLAHGVDPGEDFVYTSMESEVEGILRFLWQAPEGKWQITSSHEVVADAPLLATDEIRDASVQFVLELRDSLLGKVDLLDYLDDPQARQFVVTSIARRRLSTDDRP